MLKVGGYHYHNSSLCHSVIIIMTIICTCAIFKYSQRYEDCTGRCYLRNATWYGLSCTSSNSWENIKPIIILVFYPVLKLNFCREEGEPVFEHVYASVSKSWLCKLATKKFAECMYSLNISFLHTACSLRFGYAL